MTDQREKMQEALRQIRKTCDEPMGPSRSGLLDKIATLADTALSAGETKSDGEACGDYSQASQPHNADLQPSPSDPIPSPLWRHKKRGSVYRVLHDRATMQEEQTKSRRLDDEPMVVYQDIHSSDLYVRPVVEFFDGRFEKVIDGGEPSNEAAGKRPFPSMSPASEGKQQCNTTGVTAGETAPIPSPQPLREQVAEAIANAEYRPATDRERRISWLEVVSYNRECIRNLADAIIPIVEAAVRNSDDPLVDLVNRFSAALLEKLQAARLKYGWQSEAWRNNDWQESCQRQLLEHLAKGDPRDVAAYCAFIWHHGWQTTVAPPHPAPTAGLEPVAWRPIKTAPRDGTPILCFTPDYQSEFSDQSGIDVLWFDEGAWLYNAEPVTFQPTHWMPLPASPNSASSGYYTLAQLEAHAAEQVRPLVEALEGLIEAVELDADEGLEGIGSYTGARLTDAKNAIRARGQV